MKGPPKPPLGVMVTLYEHEGQWQAALGEFPPHPLWGYKHEGSPLGVMVTLYEHEGQWQVLQGSEVHPLVSCWGVVTAPSSVMLGCCYSTL